MPDRKHVVREWPVATVQDIPPGSRVLVEVAGRSVGVFKVHGTFVAVRNVCPHERAPICLGSMQGTTLASAPGEYRWGRAREILVCP